MRTNAIVGQMPYRRHAHTTTLREDTLTQWTGVLNKSGSNGSKSGSNGSKNGSKGNKNGSKGNKNAAGESAVGDLGAGNLA